MFLQVGRFDPYSDDPRLSVQKLSLCPLSETLVVSGTAGQTVVLQWEREQRTFDIKVTNVRLPSNKSIHNIKLHCALVHDIPYDCTLTSFMTFLPSPGQRGRRQRRLRVERTRVAASERR